MSKLEKMLTLIWIDLEMTGLIPETDRIIEIATLVTDGHQRCEIGRAHV